MKYIQFDELGQIQARYDSEIHGDKVPSDALKVSDSLFWDTINDTTGLWVRRGNSIIKEPFPPMTNDQRISAAGAEKFELLYQADKFVSKYQDMVDVSDASTEEKAMLKKWKQYRVALHRLDLTKNVAWPVAPE